MDNSDRLTYKQYPALAAYIDRIGAEQHNFRKFLVKEHIGVYYVEKTYLRLNDEYEFECKDKALLPSDTEAAAIKEELKKANWPRSILARDSAALKALIGENGGGALFEFHSNKPGTAGIIMVQERINKVDGGKIYRPWTFFSDGIWRAMEPDGKLPFWKPSGGARAARIMVHEGAKAAAFVSALVRGELGEGVGHPWLDELKMYDHWGMIGGALAPHRTDFEELWREKPVEVVYVCDNDANGQMALQEISRNFGRALKGVMFDGRWPQGWDLADPMPESFFHGGRYIGPRLEGLKMAATWATEVDGKVKKIKRDFKNEWFHSVVPEVFAHKDWPNVIMTGPEFNNYVAPFSDADDTARLLKKDAASKTGVLKYNPALPSGIYGGESGGRYLNTHVGTSVIAEKGDVSPWLGFLEQLIVDEGDRYHLMRWVATLIARPEIRMLWGVLLISETQGVGKSTLGEKILGPLVGADNVSTPNEAEIVESNYNYWVAHKRLAVCHEIYAGNSSKAYNKLKTIITDEHVTVMKKYQANYQIENWTHVLACSNSRRALQIPDDDRRWFIPRVRESGRDEAWWAGLIRWLHEENGLGKIKYWAEEWLAEEKGRVVGRGERAPGSSLKKEVVREGRSPGQLLVAGFLEALKEAVDKGDEAWFARWCKPRAANGSWPGVKGVVVLDTDLVKLISVKLHEGRPNARLERPGTIRKLAKALGWYVSDERARVKDWGTRTTEAKLICSNAELATMELGQLVELVRPVDVTAMDTELNGV